MKRLRAWVIRLSGLFRTSRQTGRQERELAEEMESHLQLHIEDNLRSGMTPEQARRDAVGLAAAFALSHLLKSLLFAVGPHDPVSFIAVTLLLGIVALAATLIPARAAMKTDPMTALRQE